MAIKGLKTQNFITVKPLEGVKFKQKLSVMSHAYAIFKFSFSILLIKLIQTRCLLYNLMLDSHLFVFSLSIKFIVCDVIMCNKRLYTAFILTF